MFTTMPWNQAVEHQGKKKTSINIWVQFHNFGDKKSQPKEKTKKLQGSRVRDKEVLRQKSEPGGKNKGCYHVYKLKESTGTSQEWQRPLSRSKNGIKMPKESKSHLQQERLVVFQSPGSLNVNSVKSFLLMKSHMGNWPLKLNRTLSGDSHKSQLVPEPTHLNRLLC